LAFFGNCFGYFIQKLGEFSPNLLVALAVSEKERKVFTILTPGLMVVPSQASIATSVAQATSPTTATASSPSTGPPDTTQR
jgi:hypothetical protein